MTAVRAAAARMLLAIDRREGTLGAVLEAERAEADDGRDAALLTALVAGVLRWRNEIDAVIASAGRRSVKSIDAPVLAVLRLGVYQLRHLDRVPDHAVVHASVAAVRTLGASSGAGFVNAVLRAVIRRGSAISLPGRPATDNLDAQVNYLSITLSHPAWLVRRWIGRYGFDAAEAWCRFNNTIPEVTVRAIDGSAVEELAQKLRAQGVDAAPAAHVDSARRLPAGALGRLPAAVRAQLQVQDEGAQIVAHFAAVRPDERVLDLCASPGGKTLVMAEALGRNRAAGARGLFAADHRARRVALLHDTLKRARLDVPIVRLDGTAPLPFDRVFDCILIDAPCSGLGTLRRDPDLKWSRTIDDLAPLAETQLRMLTCAADAVRPGGRLIYATCSSEPEENAEVVDAFLRQDARFLAADPPDAPGVPASLIDGRGHLVTRPDRDALDAFFGAVLVRRGSP